MLNKVIGGGRTGSKEGVVNAMMSTAGVRIPEKLPPRSQLFDHSSGKECYIILVDVCRPLVYSVKSSIDLCCMNMNMLLSDCININNIIVTAYYEIMMNPTLPSVQCMQMITKTATHKLN